MTILALKFFNFLVKKQDRRVEINKEFKTRELKMCRHYKVENVENGCILSSWNEQDEEKETYVFERKSDEGPEETRAFQEFLYLILEKYGPNDANSDFCKHKIHIEIKPGFEYVDMQGDGMVRD